MTSRPVDGPEPGVRTGRHRPPFVWTTCFVVAVVLQVLPVVVRRPGAVAAAVAGALAIAFLVCYAVVPVAMGRVHLQGTVVVARTVWPRRLVDLARLESVGGSQMRSNGGGADVLSLHDADGAWVVLLGPPGFAPPRGGGAWPRTDIHRQVRETVLRGDVVVVSEDGKAVLGLPAGRDLSESAFTLACWVIFLVLTFGYTGATVLLWGRVIPL